MRTFRFSRCYDCGMRRGFTIVEVLVVLGVTSLLASIIITYTGSSRNRVLLSVEEAKIAQSILGAKSLSVATYNRPDIPCGYGMVFDYAGNSYSTFSYDAPQCDSIQVIDPSFVTLVREFELPSALILGGDPAGAVEYILFIPPDPKTFIWTTGSFSTTTRGTVTVETRDGSDNEVVEVNFAGQVSF